MKMKYYDGQQTKQVLEDKSHRVTVPTLLLHVNYMIGCLFQCVRVHVFVCAYISVCVFFCVHTLLCECVLLILSCFSVHINFV